jgi:hypothetical protein
LNADSVQQVKGVSAMNMERNTAKHILLCLLAGFGFLMLVSEARALGGAAAGLPWGFDPAALLRPGSWIAPLTQLPMPLTLIVFLLFALFRGRAGALVMAVGCLLGAFFGGWVSGWPVDYSHGYPLNYGGGYVSGGMLELMAGLGSILLAAGVQFVLLQFWRGKEKKNSAVEAADGRRIRE